jgi:hypothetical protein
MHAWWPSPDKSIFAWCVTATPSQNGIAVASSLNHDAARIMTLTMSSSLEVCNNVLTALIQLAESMIFYLANVHHTLKECIALSSELTGLLNLLQLLENHLKASDSSDAWFSLIRALGIQDGALDQLRYSLQKLVVKLGDTLLIAMPGRSLTWKFDKAEIKDILQCIERIKSLVSLALTDDLW